MSNFSFADCIQQQIQLHPSFTPQDAIKLSYQATFGAEHLLQEAAPVQAYFEREYANTRPADVPLYELVSQDYCRVNLAAWKYQALPPEWLFQIFFLTASEPSGSDAAALQQYFAVIDALALKGRLPFSADDWAQCRTQYEAAQPAGSRPQPVHHSEAYRAAEHPAYRIIHTRYVRVIPILQAIAALPPCSANEAAVIAIDGRAASGKSTLADQLTIILQAGLIHMDDFFLPPALRSAERLAEPGGNVHYERFTEEVLPQLRKQNAFSYICFDCSQMAMGEPRQVMSSAYRIVEGSYSCHPTFGNYMDLRILCDVDPKTQMQRIMKRNGPELAQMFESRWIPMEEKYFETFQIRNHADMIFQTH